MDEREEVKDGESVMEKEGKVGGIRVEKWESRKEGKRRTVGGLPLCCT